MCVTAGNPRPRTEKKSSISLGRDGKNRILLEAITISADNDLSLRFVVLAHSRSEKKQNIIDGLE